MSTPMTSVAPSDASDRLVTTSHPAITSRVEREERHFVDLGNGTSGSVPMDAESWRGVASATVVETSGGSMPVRIGGRGATVLLIHGIPANGELWLGVAAELVRTCRVIVPDLIGFGSSVRRRGAPVDVASQAGYLIEMLAQVVGDEQVVVVGQDIGGAVAQVLACDHTNRVAGLMLLNAVAYDSWPIPVMRIAQRSMPALRRARGGPLLAVMQRALRRELRSSVDRRALPELFIAPFRTADGYRNLLDLIAALDARHTVDRSARLGHLGVPFSLVWGARDRFQPRRIGERLAADAGLDGLTILPEAAHFSPADAPVEIAAEIARLAVAAA